MFTHRGIELIGSLPVCLRVVAELQKILVRNTRGDSYDAGRLRERLVCIGDRGGGIEQSRFVPPPHGEPLRQGVSEWEGWINAENDIPLLVKAALGHYQFETLHPFSDGNGRIGRLIVTLQLMEAKALIYPILNLSPWFEPRREDYIGHLLSVSQTGDFDPWVSFFAQAVRERSESAYLLVDKLTNFRKEVKATLRDGRAKGVITDVADNLIGYPVVSVSEIATVHGITYQAANSVVARLEKMDILREFTGKTYGRLFVCDRVYSILFLTD